MYTLGINAAYHDPAACLVATAGRGGRRRGALHARQARQAADSVFRTRSCRSTRSTIACVKPASCWPMSIMSPIRSIPACCSVRNQGRDTISLPLRAAARFRRRGVRRSAWDPLFLASIVNAPRQLASGAPHHLAGVFGASRRTVPIAGISSNTTWPTQPAPSLPRPSSARGADHGRPRRNGHHQLRRVRRPRLSTARAGRHAALAGPAVRAA